MSSYNCTKCGSYTTDRKSNLTRHMANCSVDYMNKYQCLDCENFYAGSSCLTKHKLVCSKIKRKMEDYEHKLELIKKDNENLLNIIKVKDEQIDGLEGAAKHYKDMVISAGTLLQSSVNALSYLVKNHENAPDLERIQDYSFIHKNIALKEFVLGLAYEYNNNKR